VFRNGYRLQAKKLATGIDITQIRLSLLDEGMDLEQLVTDEYGLEAVMIDRVLQG
jgi:hypothetical protein